MSAEISDGDLVRLARAGDTAAFRLLVERHQPAARARARALCGNPSDVDDVVQESFLQAFTGLDRLREPDRFAGWLAGIVLNVTRALHRRDRLTLVSDLPEPLHPTAADGVPSAEDLDRAEALHTAVASLPEGQRRAVALHYYAGLPPGQIAETGGAARASLHKARLRLRAYLADHRPDLVPAAWRTHMATVRIARIEPHLPPGPVPDRFPTHVIVLADDHGHRELPIWLLGGDSHRFTHERSAEELTCRLLRAADATVTGVDVDDLGADITAARIGLSGPAGTRSVAARLPDGLAVAIAAGAPIRVAGALLDRLAVQVTPGSRPGPITGQPAEVTGQAGPVPEQTAFDLRLDIRPRYEPRNMTFADGLHRWEIGGSFSQHVSQAHWQDYSCAAEDGAAVLYSAVPRPEGFAFLGQEIFADDYREAAVVFRGQVRVTGAGDAPVRAGLFLRVRTPPDLTGLMTEAAMLADPANHIVAAPAGPGWASHELTAHIPRGANTIVFGAFLAGPGRIELRNPELTVQTERT